MKEIANGLYLAGGHHPANITANIIAIIKIRDEMWRIPFFLAYHRWLGVEHFVFIDNNSKDGLVDLLLSQHDVTVILAPGNFSEYQQWIKSIFSFSSSTVWNLILDADELFVPQSLHQGGLISTIRKLNDENVAIAVTSMVDCYPETFPITNNCDLIPWKRAPFFDSGPYFEWPTLRVRPRHYYHGVRERVCWPAWRWRKLFPRFIRKSRMAFPPPIVAKMPLLRNVPGLIFEDIHFSYGATRSNQLFALLHYKLDWDLSQKVKIALQERQYWAGSQEYEAYARLFSKPFVNLQNSRTNSFDGVNSLVQANLMRLNSNTYANDLNLSEIEDQISSFGSFST